MKFYISILLISFYNLFNIGDHETYLSITELMIKASIRKFEVNFDPIAIAKESGFELLDFSAEDALALKELPFHHRDPFDRMLVSQALNRKYALMTDDGKISQYDCRLI